jgi:hypothetical protein
MAESFVKSFKWDYAFLHRRLLTTFSCSWPHGSAMTTRSDLIAACQCTPHGSSFAANYPPQRVRFSGGNSS